MSAAGSAAPDPDPVECLIKAKYAMDPCCQTLFLLRFAIHLQLVPPALHQRTKRLEALYKHDVVQRLATQLEKLLRLLLIHDYLIQKDNAFVLNTMILKTYNALFTLDKDLTDVDDTGVPTLCFYKTKDLVARLGNIISNNQTDLLAAIEDTEECLTPVKSCSPEHARSTKPPRAIVTGDFQSLTNLCNAARSEPPRMQAAIGPVGGLNKGRNRRVFDFNKGRRSLYTPGINKVHPGGGIEQSPKRKLREFAKDGAKESSEVRLRRMVKLTALGFSAALSVYAASL